MDLYKYRTKVGWLFFIGCSSYFDQSVINEIDCINQRARYSSSPKTPTIDIDRYIESKRYGSPETPTGSRLLLTEKRKVEDFDEINDYKKLKIIETKEEMEKEMKNMEQEMKSMRINFMQQISNDIGRFIDDASNKVKQEFEMATENYKRLTDLKKEELEEKADNIMEIKKVEFEENANTIMKDKTEAFKIATDYIINTKISEVDKKITECYSDISEISEKIDALKAKKRKQPIRKRPTKKN